MNLNTIILALALDKPIQLYRSYKPNTPDVAAYHQPKNIRSIQFSQYKVGLIAVIETVQQTKRNDVILSVISTPKTGEDYNKITEKIKSIWKLLLQVPRKGRQETKVSFSE